MSRCVGLREPGLPEPETEAGEPEAASERQQEPRAEAGEPRQQTEGESQRPDFVPQLVPGLVPGPGATADGETP